MDGTDFSLWEFGITCHEWGTQSMDQSVAEDREEEMEKGVTEDRDEEYHFSRGESWITLPQSRGERVISRRDGSTRCGARPNQQ